ncbi:zinc-binding dehydrogenase [Antrihabitans sp. NCIMB 15449]|uniref:Alcohol dehydrogenase catalytic domain-containing protein n=2 Tax=Antrihabitans TaxID=2799491 RepID=A0A934NN08_9NOCA|nr:alcohol dehydrogenase catalytic domain-containing protein [Antrihabitans stalagmiti]MBJ8338172.1 alcohol dehydrogenase catalytic domain-containing protein [Antrihabitans stalagmiti]
MKRLLLEGTARVTWEDVAEPQLGGPQSALVRPIAVATCDLDVFVLRGAYPLPGPYPFGHEAVAEVVAVGDEVTAVSPGDRVIVPFQISCGSCGPCLRGRTGNCRSNPRMSSYGLGTMGGLEWGGLLTDLALVPHADAMLVPLPQGIDPAMVASASDNIPDAWRTVGPQLAAEPGAEVLVVGGDAGPASIGLYAVGIAVALGAARVVYLDDNDERLAIAAAFGAEPMQGPYPRKAGEFPITVDASGAEAGLRCALNSTAGDGTCTSPSLYLSDPAMPLLAMYSRCCTFHTGRAHVRPAIPQVLALVEAGFDPSIVTSQVVPWDSAAEALEAPPMKLVVTR